MKSIYEVSRETGASTTSIYKKIRKTMKKQLAPHLSQEMREGKLITVVDDSGFEMLKTAFSTAANTIDTVDNTPETVSNGLETDVKPDETGQQPPDDTAAGTAEPPEVETPVETPVINPSETAVKLSQSVTSISETVDNGLLKTIVNSMQRQLDAKDEQIKALLEQLSAAGKENREQNDHIRQLSSRMAGITENQQRLTAQTNQLAAKDDTVYTDPEEKKKFQWPFHKKK